MQIKTDVMISTRVLNFSPKISLGMLINVILIRKNYMYIHSSHLFSQILESCHLSRTLWNSRTAV